MQRPASDKGASWRVLRLGVLLCCLFELLVGRPIKGPVVAVSFSIMCILLGGCVAGVGSATHKPLESVVRGGSVTFRLRTSPVRTFSDVTFKARKRDEMITQEAMEHTASKRGGDHWEYEFTVPSDFPYDGFLYAITYVHAGTERISGWYAIKVLDRTKDARRSE